jgi:hypothetical protein
MTLAMDSARVLRPGTVGEHDAVRFRARLSRVQSRYVRGQQRRRSELDGSQTQGCERVEREACSHGCWGMRRIRGERNLGADGVRVGCR